MEHILSFVRDAAAPDVAVAPLRLLRLNDPRIFEGCWPGMLVTVATTTWPWEAELLRSRLDTEGLLAFVADDHAITANWSLSVALGGAKIRVPEADAEAATEIVRACRAGAYAEELTTLFGDARSHGCPDCGSPEIGNRPSAGSLLVLAASFLLGGIAYSLPQSVHSCRACGQTWKD